MSKIVSPIEPMDWRGMTFPTEAHWWRLRLSPNADGHLYVMTALPRDAPEDQWTAIEIEFFDGFNTIIDCGFEKPTRACLMSDDDGYSFAEWVDVLSVDKPTPCDRWRPLTTIGNHKHPADDMLIAKPIVRQNGSWRCPSCWSARF